MAWIEVYKERHKLRGAIWVKCVAEIRENASGEVVEYDTDEILSDGEPFPSVFNWEYNNFACDCNRILFFHRAKGDESDRHWDTHCTDGKFSVNLKNKKDGVIYYREF